MKYFIFFIFVVSSIICLFFGCTSGEKIKENTLIAFPDTKVRKWGDEMIFKIAPSEECDSVWLYVIYNFSDSSERYIFPMEKIFKKVFSKKIIIPDKLLYGYAIACFDRNIPDAFTYDCYTVISPLTSTGDSIPSFENILKLPPEKRSVYLRNDRMDLIFKYLTFMTKRLSPDSAREFADFIVKEYKNFPSAQALASAIYSHIGENDRAYRMLDDLLQHKEYEAIAYIISSIVYDYTDNDEVLKRISKYCNELLDNDVMSSEMRFVPVILAEKGYLSESKLKKYAYARWKQFDRDNIDFTDLMDCISLSFKVK
ncbi:hypothetical protein DRQ26_04250, partial [bacterium]